MPELFPKGRLATAIGLMVLGYCGLAGRLYYLQVLQHEELLVKARINTERTFVRHPRRGDIRDVRGNLLATSKEVKTVCADPTLIASNEVAVAAVLAPFLRLDAASLAEKLKVRMRTNASGEILPSKYVVLKRKVEEEEWAQIKVAMAGLKFAPDEKKLPRKKRQMYSQLRQYAIFTEPDELRVYPNENLASHVLGYAGTEQLEKGGSRSVGQDGVELILNSVLTGMQGWRQTETDKRQREIVSWRQQDVAPRAGLNAVLTLDAGLQHILESELAEVMKKHSPESVVGIIVRPRTGEILAMANLPDFDPNKPGDGVLPEARRNRAVTDLAEPGSTYKIVVVSAALQAGLVTLEDSFDCEHGRFIYAGRPLRDDHSYGVLSVESIITKSSNIGAAKIGIKLGETDLHQAMLNFGFGRKTGILLPGEINGIVHPLKSWNKLSITRIPMGHEVGVTPIQMIMAMAAIANGGTLMRPMLLDRIEDEHGNVVEKYQPRAVRRILSESTARQMVRALKTVVSTNGTAARARLEYYNAAGKTGTAQKAGRGGYIPGKYFSSFIGFFPATHPELCISIVLDEPKHGHYGGDTAAPAFARVAERAANYLAIPPDKSVTDSLVAAKAAKNLVDSK